jgi:hypothetical protein
LFVTVAGIPSTLLNPSHTMSEFFTFGIEATSLFGGFPLKFVGLVVTKPCSQCAISLYVVDVVRESPAMLKILSY